MELWLSLSAWPWANQTPEQTKLLLWGPKSGRPVLPPSFMIRLCHQLDSAYEQCHWLGLLLGSAGINSVYQDWMLVVGSLPAFSVTVRFQGLSSKYSLAIFMVPQSSPHSWRAGDWMSRLGFPSCYRNDRLRRHPLTWCCTSLGRRAIQSACSNSSYPLISMPWCRVGASASPLSSRILTVVPWPLVIASCSSCEGEQSGMTYVVILVTSLLFFLFCMFFTY